MTGGTRNAILLAGGALAFAGMVELALWILPAPHRPFHYLLAGTLATAVTLAALLAMASLRGVFGASRRRVAPGRTPPRRVAGAPRSGKPYTAAARIG